MSASKIKNLILLILLLGVLGLLPAVVPTQAARTGAERNVHEKLEALYSSYGLTLDASGLPSSQTLYAIEIENPDASNAAQALLGSKYTAGETAARMLANCTSELGSISSLDGFCRCVRFRAAARIRRGLQRDGGAEPLRRACF